MDKAVKDDRIQQQLDCVLQLVRDLLPGFRRVSCNFEGRANIIIIISVIIYYCQNLSHEQEEDEGPGVYQLGGCVRHPRWSI